MRMILAIALSGSVIVASDMVLARDVGQSGQIKLAQTRICPQVVHCGEKNNVVKEYPTKCAAEDDGAKNIVPKGPSGCPQVK